MIIAWDTETRGLFGDIFAFGVYDGNKYIKLDSPKDFIPLLKSYNEPIYAYAHNLDFDIAKLWKKAHFSIDWDESFVINNNMVKVKVKGENIWLCDSYSLMPASLETISKEFELTTPKYDLEKYIYEQGYKDKADFFSHVPADDEVLNTYLKYDCMALYEFLSVMMNLGNFEEKEFIKCLTLPSLSMRIFRKKYADDYEEIKKVKMSKVVEDISREAYFGGRVEVIKPEIDEGYYYDVNSLYPYCMKVNSFPAGVPYHTWSPKSTGSAYELFKQGVHKHCIVQATVHVPDMHIPPLPLKREGKLLFPVGIFSGSWAGEELAMAESYGVKILAFSEGVYWKESKYIFKKFITDMEKEKTTSTGARRMFFKNIQNSLYGKLGMARMRDSFVSMKHEKKLIETDKPYLKIIMNGEEVLHTMKPFYADYIKPFLAAYVTAYSRILLYKTINKYKDSVYYFDTDSIVIDVQMESKEVDSKQYGKWKLEHIIEKGVFLQPKLYAIIDNGGKEILKSKGLVSDYRKTLNYKSYDLIHEVIKKGGEVFELYSDIPMRRKFIMTLIKNIDVDVPLMARKTLHLSKNQKRNMDYINNCSTPKKIYCINNENMLQYLEEIK